MIISDETDAHGIISIQGPKSRQLLSSLVDGQNESVLSNESFTFSTSKKINLKVGIDKTEEILALRMTFVGELGYELYAPVDSCVDIVENLINNKTGVKVYDNLLIIIIELIYLLLNE